MRRIVVAEFVSLDGIMGEPAWTFPYWGDDIAAFKQPELFASDSLLLGRVTYEGFAAAWPGRTDQEGYADRMNNMPKHVVTTTLDKLDWNNSHIIAANVAEEVAKLKQGEGGDILVFGSATLVDTLIQHDLVDRYNLLIYPVVLGGGLRMFKDDTKTKFKLVESKSFSSGVALLVYEPDRAES